MKPFLRRWALVSAIGLAIQVGVEVYIAARGPLIVPGSTGMNSSWGMLIFDTLASSVALGAFLSFAFVFAAHLDRSHEELKSVVARTGIPLNAVWGTIQLTIGLLGSIAATYALFHGLMNWLLKGSWQLQTWGELSPGAPLKSGAAWVGWLLHLPFAPIELVIAGLLVRAGVLRLLDWREPVRSD